MSDSGDPHLLHTQPLRPRYIDSVRVEYFAVYPDGRRYSVTKFDALCLGEYWLKEGVRVVTCVRYEAVRIIGDCEGCP